MPRAHRRTHKHTHSRACSNASVKAPELRGEPLWRLFYRVVKCWQLHIMETNWGPWVWCVSWLVRWMFQNTQRIVSMESQTFWRNLCWKYQKSCEAKNQQSKQKALLWGVRTWRGSKQIHWPRFTNIFRNLLYNNASYYCDIETIWIQEIDSLGVIFRDDLLRLPIEMKGALLHGGQVVPSDLHINT